MNIRYTGETTAIVAYNVNLATPPPHQTPQPRPTTQTSQEQRLQIPIHKTGAPQDQNNNSINNNKQISLWPQIPHTPHIPPPRHIPPSSLRKIQWEPFYHWGHPRKSWTQLLEPNLHSLDSSQKQKDILDSPCVPVLELE